MNTEEHQLTVSGLKVNVVRKAIKNLHLGVYPPAGRVRVAAPLGISDSAVRMAVVGKLGWIKRQRKRFQLQPRQSRREMVSGESHYFLGQRYRLQLIPRHGLGRVVIRNRSTMEMHVPPTANAAQREQILRQWYRQQLTKIIPPLLEKWVTRKTGDEGIDGVINEDRLGLDVIYVQAKRWKGNVGRQEIQSFVGALAGKKASRGVFITTSEFNDNATDYADGLHQKVILIDGRRLAELMIEHNIGVAEEHAYRVKKIDSDYFDEA